MRFHQIWSLNWLGRRKLMLSIYINRLLHHIWYLHFRCPATHLKLSAEDLDIRLRIWVWICRLVWKSLTNVLGPDIWFQETRPRILWLVYKSRLKLSTGYQDSRRRVSDVRSDVWNSDIRHDAVICRGREPTYLIHGLEKQASNMKIR